MSQDPAAYVRRLDYYEATELQSEYADTLASPEEEYAAAHAQGNQHAMICARLAPAISRKVDAALARLGLEDDPMTYSELHAIAQFAMHAALDAASV